MNNMQLKATSPLTEWLSYLEKSHFKPIDLGLDRIKSEAEKLDLPHPAPYVITVGGTNGKGTTCRLLETILLNHGLRVGVYSSPHLLRYNERVRIQNQDLPDEAHTASFAFIDENKTESLTYFEFSTLSALHLFKQVKLDVVILEVGLGGRLDATNIVDSHLAVIVPQTMLDQAEKLHCQVARRDVDWSFEQNAENWQWKNKKVRLENLPICQIPLANAATALAAVQCLPFDISEQTLRKSLQEVELVGRFQAIKADRREKLADYLGVSVETLPTIIVDVGHNPHAAKYLSEKLTALKHRIEGKMIAVCGMLKDKDANGVFAHLTPIIDEWHCVTLGGYRGQSGDELADKLKSHFPHVQATSDNSVMDGMRTALKSAVKNDVVLVFGSFHTVAEFWSVVE